jgi:hypothetical protein
MPVTESDRPSMTRNRPPPRVGFPRAGPNNFSTFAGRLKYVSNSATVGGSHYWNGGYVQTGGQFKQLGEGAKKIRVL